MTPSVYVLCVDQGKLLYSQKYHTNANTSNYTLHEAN